MCSSDLAYSRNQPCRHNVNYWQFGDYLGIGAGAHGKISTPENITRRWKTRLPKNYIDHYKDSSATLARSGSGYRQSLVPADELPLEFLMNALRLIDGFELALFETRTGLNREVLAAFLDQGAVKGLLEVNRLKVRPTARGILFLDELLALSG